MTPELSDAELLAAVDRMWRQADPPPDGLAEGVLARLAAEELEFDLLTLVSTSDGLAGVRSAPPADRDLDEQVPATSVEFAGSQFRVLLRISRHRGRARLDGWVVPARALEVRLESGSLGAAEEALVDQHGRFDFTDVTPGACRLRFVDPQGDTRPQATPPFWV